MLFHRLKLFFVNLIRRLFFRYILLDNGTKVSIFVRGLKNFHFEGQNSVPEFVVASGSIQLGYRTTLGVHNFLFGDIKIGRYCQIGGYVAFHGTDHPVTFASTYIGSNLFHGELASLKQSQSIILGNDVWVGHGVIILKGVNVGNGAILAAGSVITKNVPAYSIVAGNPGRVIKYRFSNEIISELENLKWWDMSDDKLVLLKELFKTDLSQVTSILDIVNYDNC